MDSIKLPRTYLSKKLEASIKKQVAAGSLNPFLRDMFFNILEYHKTAAIIMAHKAEGKKKDNWEEMEKDISLVLDYVGKLHFLAIKYFEANKKSPCDTLILMEENKRLKSTQNKLSKENESLKNQLERYVAKYGV